MRLAGRLENKQLDPGEYYDDNHDANPRDGIFEDDDTGQDIGLITKFDPDSQVVVNDHGYAAFVAFDRDNKKSIFFTRINTGSAVAADPYCIIAVGDSIPGLEGTVSDLALSDSLNDRGQPGDLVFWVSTSSGDQAIVTTRPRQKPLVFIPGMAGSELDDFNTLLLPYWPALEPFSLAGLTMANGL